MPGDALPQSNIFCFYGVQKIIKLLLLSQKKKMKNLDHTKLLNSVYQHKIASSKRLWKIHEIEKQKKWKRKNLCLRLLSRPVSSLFALTL